MDAHQKTYDVSGPPSMALARMALRKAAARHFGVLPPADFWRGDPPSRECVCPTCRYYFEIVDRITWSSHPDWNTPNWCSKCSPADIGYCRCEIASNE